MIVINWRDSEWGDEGVSALYEGYEADVYPNQQKDGAGAWFWRVDATSAVSESPELCDCGFASNIDVAKREAEDALVKAAS